MILVVGAGLAGCVIAERIASELNKEVLVIDRRDHLAGNTFDYKDENGVTVHKYGPHAFHTNNGKVWEYLSSFTEWLPYFHQVEAFIDGQSVPVPFNFNTINMLFDEHYASDIISKLINVYGLNKKVTILELLQNSDFKELAKYVYQKIFLGYTMKQWGKKPEDLDISVSGRVPIYTGRDNRYFHDKYQAVPEKGYTAMVENMLSSDLIKLELEKDFKDIDTSKFEKIVYTGMVDEYFDYRFGMLDYRSLSFSLKTVNKPYYQNTAQKNFSENFDFTRITEFKYFLDEQTDKSTIAFEYPSAYVHGENEPYYPVPDDKNAALYKKYSELAAKESRTVFVGRLAEYKYYNMEQVVERALELFEKKLKNL